MSRKKIEKVVEEEIIEEAPAESKRQAELRKIFEAYKKVNPVKAEQKEAEFKRKLANAK